MQADLEVLLDPKGKPMSLIQWTTKSVAKLKEALGKRLHALGFSLRANKKTVEGSAHADRDAQFGHIKQACEQFEAADDPIISVDCKKKELTRTFQADHAA